MGSTAFLLETPEKIFVTPTPRSIPWIRSLLQSSKSATMHQILLPVTDLPPPLPFKKTPVVCYSHIFRGSVTLVPSLTYPPPHCHVNTASWGWDLDPFKRPLFLLSLQLLQNSMSQMRKPQRDMVVGGDRKEGKSWWVVLRRVAERAEGCA